MSDAIILPDDHVETRVLRQYARNARCAVIAAYQGATMRYLFEHGAADVVGVEPQEWARDLAIKNLLALGPCAWEIDCLALVPWETAPDSMVSLYLYGTDGATLDKATPETGEMVHAMNVMEWLGQYDGQPFDFMVVNCEGAEYMLLPWLSSHTRVLLVQYHGPPMPKAMLDRFRNVESIGKGWYLYT